MQYDAADVDAWWLEGMLEWYAIEAVKHELECILNHRITSDSDRLNWLPYSQDGKDTCLTITEEEMAFTPANVHAPLEDRSVTTWYSSFPRTHTTKAAVQGDGAPCAPNHLREQPAQEQARSSRVADSRPVRSQRRESVPEH